MQTESAAATRPGHMCEMITTPRFNGMRRTSRVQCVLLAAALVASFSQEARAGLVVTGMAHAAGRPGHAYMHLPYPSSGSMPGLPQVAVCRDNLKGALKGGLETAGRVFTTLESFLFGAAGGAAGASVMFPVEAIKMRMQAVGRGATFDGVLRSALKTEGLAGLYQGLRPTVLAVAPEKAVMFGVNGVLRTFMKPLTDERGMLPLPLEMAVGGAAGLGQVLFSSPKEMVMVQMQMASQQGVTPAMNNPLVHIKKLGLRNMYRGASATILRDVPFAAIYFAAYSRVKLAMGARPDRPLNFFETLAAATAAAIPAAFLTTPADVMKTRLQAAAGAGGRIGVPQVASHILKTEGIKGFFVGAPIRVGLKAPTLGVALLVVEVLTHICHDGIKAPDFRRIAPARA